MTKANGKTKLKAKKNPALEPSDHPLARIMPLGDRVVVRRDQAKKETVGGILLPDSAAKNKQQMGTVYRVGPGKLLDNGQRAPMEVQRGQRVLITGYAGLEIRDPFNTDTQDQEFVMLRAEDVLGYEIEDVEE